MKTTSETFPMARRIFFRLIAPGLVLVLLGIVGLISWLTTGQFGWPAVTIIIVSGIGIWGFRNRHVRGVFGEEPPIQRSRVHWSVLLGFWVILFPSLSIYVLINEVVRTNPPAQFSMMVVAPILGGLALTAASGFKEKRDLVRVAQKFIMATIFFIIFLPSIYVIDNLLGIDPNSLEWSEGALVRALYFWVAVSSFFGGIILFLVGLVDLVFTLIALSSESTEN